MFIFSTFVETSHMAVCLFEYVIRKAHEKQVGPKSNATHQHLAYGDDVNLLRDDIDTVNKNKETSVDASR
jgi:hypothetical protein